MNCLPAQVPLPIKIAIYRFVQEALNNAFYHAAGAGQQVAAKYNVGLLSIEVCDEGPGFDIAKLSNLEEHLGLAGMRDRIESLEGMFRIESAPGQGTKVIARLLLRQEDVKE
jgi:signal transduction histidine kinase